jgi:NADH-ubiquinone oxidoreductase chain 5
VALKGSLIRIIYFFLGLISLIFIYYLIIENLYLGISIELPIFLNEWIDVTLVLTIDFVSIGYLFCVLLVLIRVIIFSVFYMSGTVNHRRFFYSVILFAGSIFLLVLSDRFVLIIIGWDGLGIVSFCLVIFYERPRSLRSGILTILTNRLGDSLFLCIIFFILRSGGAASVSFNFSNYIFILLLITGRMTKRAQVPFSSWLPAAIAAPTPVSSLVHSSTLVTAGLYVLIRYNFAFYEFQIWLCSLGLLTLCVAGLRAIIETDLKKVVAISTLSQLGFIISILSVGIWKLSLTHIIFHSFFKSMLFISVGGLIFSSYGGQDFRSSPRTLNNKWINLLITTRRLSLLGFPFVIGFYSKDIILSMSVPYQSCLFTLIFFIGCIFSLIYTRRLIIYRTFKTHQKNPFSTNNPNYIFLFSSIFLLIRCFFVGSYVYIAINRMNLINQTVDTITWILFFFLLTISLKLIKFIKLLNKVSMDGSFISWIRKGGISSSLVFFKLQKREQSWIEFLSRINSISRITRHFLEIELKDSFKLLIILLPFFFFIYP